MGKPEGDWKHHPILERFNERSSYADDAPRETASANVVSSEDPAPPAANNSNPEGQWQKIFGGVERWNHGSQADEKRRRKRGSEVELI
jgi:hypothetical protein